MKKQVTLYTMFMAGVLTGVMLKTLYIDFLEEVPLNNPGCLINEKHSSCKEKTNP